jgi:serine/threonine protein kinase
VPAAIGRCRPTRLLGKGGQRVVYRAHVPRLARDVAVKTVTRGRRAPECLVAGACNVAFLEHPVIVPLYEFKFGQITPFLICRDAGGQPLTALIDRPEPSPIHRSARMLIGALDAIGYAHRQGLLNRDLHPPPPQRAGRSRWTCSSTRFRRRLGHVRRHHR